LKRVLSSKSEDGELKPTALILEAATMLIGELALLVASVFSGAAFYVSKNRLLDSES
jgi:hypothetical protein